MKLFVGLGNPGGKYEKTRHNIGFLAVDAIADARGFSSERQKFQSILREGRLGSEKAAILKPQTFMNLSGQAVGEAMRFWRLEPEEIFVFHDELDLAPGRIKVKTGGGHAGHNGLRSLHEHIGSAYHRIRIGIGHPGEKRLVSNYVLKDFAKADWDWIRPLLDGIDSGAELLAAGDAGGFMNKVALKTQPQREGPAAPRKATQASADASLDAPPDPKPKAPDKPASEGATGQSPFARLADVFRKRD